MEAMGKGSFDYSNVVQMNLRAKPLALAVSVIVGWSKVPTLAYPPLNWD